MSQTPAHQQLLPRVPGGSRPPRRRVRHDVQRHGGTDWPLELRLPNLRPVEFPRHALLHRVDPAPVLHRSGPLLRHRQAAEVHVLHDGQGGGLHDRRGVDGAHTHLISANLLRLVHDSRAPGEITPTLTNLPNPNQSRFHG